MPQFLTCASYAYDCYLYRSLGCVLCTVQHRGRNEVRLAWWNGNADHLRLYPDPLTNAVVHVEESSSGHTSWCLRRGRRGSQHIYLLIIILTMTEDQFAANLVAHTTMYQGHLLPHYRIIGESEVFVAPQSRYKFLFILRTWSR